MVTIASFATRLKTENNESDIAAATFEYLIDNAIDYINLTAGTSIADLSGDAGTKSVTASEGELAAIKTLSGLLLRAYNDKGPEVGVGGLSVSEITSDPHYRVFMKLFNESLHHLRGRSFERT
jgi:hypothetical protein